MKTAKRAWAFMFGVVGDAKTVDGWRAAALRWLLRAFAFGAGYLAAWVCVMAIYALALCVLATPFLLADGFALSLYTALTALVLIYVLVSPAVYGMMFRLRARRGFRSVLATVAVYAPIFGLAVNAVIIALSLLVPIPFTTDAGEGAPDCSLGDSPFENVVRGLASLMAALLNAVIIALLALAPFADFWGTFAFGDWMPFALIIGGVASGLTARAYRMGKAPAPPPAITASRFYAPIEITISIAALVCILSVPILSD